MVVVAEGVKPPVGRADTEQVDAFGFERLGGVAYQIAPMLEKMTGFETRVTVLGHIQRGGAPTAYDRVLGTRLGVGAADLAAEGRWGTMVALKGRDITAVTLEEACESTRGVDEALYETAQVFFG